MPSLTHVKELLSLSQEMCAVLQGDKQALIERNIEQLQKSDEKKLTLLASIQQIETKLAHEWGTNWHGSVLESLTAVLQQSKTTSAEGMGLHQQLKESVEECRALMQTNQQLLKASVGHVQAIFQHLNPTQQAHDVYERPRVQDAL